MIKLYNAMIFKASFIEKYSLLIYIYFNCKLFYNKNTVIFTHSRINYNIENKLQTGTNVFIQ